MMLPEMGDVRLGSGDQANGADAPYDKSCTWGLDNTIGMRKKPIDDMAVKGVSRTMSSASIRNKGVPFYSWSSKIMACRDTVVVG